jgi:hypothetical protein
MTSKDFKNSEDVDLQETPKDVKEENEDLVNKNLKH